MLNKEIIQTIESQVVELISDQPELFLISVKGDAKNNFRVFLDGDNGVTIDACARLNRKLYKFIEAISGFEEGNFSLEVSSPGLDEPLHNPRQYRKNIGRPIEITLADGTVKEGVLKEFADGSVTLACTTGKGKKMEQFDVVIPETDIKTTKIKIVI